MEAKKHRQRNNLNVWIPLKEKYFLWCNVDEELSVQAFVFCFSLSSRGVQFEMLAEKLNTTTGQPCQFTGVEDWPLHPAAPPRQPTLPMHKLQGGAGTLHYLWNGGGIELAEGGLSMWAFVNLLARCECIIFHNQPPVWCTQENEAAVALQME